MPGSSVSPWCSLLIGAYVQSDGSKTKNRHIARIGYLDCGHSLFGLRDGPMPNRPRPVLSKTDRQLIVLLADIITRGPEGENESTELPALTDQEALHLLQLLESLLEDRRFKHTAFFAQSVLNGMEDKVARRIYSSMRRDLGKTTVMVSREFKQLQMKLIYPDRLGYPPARLNPFSFAEFLRYENVLFHEVGLDIRVRNVLTRFLSQCENSLKAERSDKGFSRESATNLVARTAEAIRLGVIRWKVGLDLTKPRYASLLTIVTNASAMFTTRDWTAVGTLSTVAAVIGNDLQASKDGK